MVVPLFQLDSIRLELMEVLVLWTEELSDVSWTEEVSELTDVSTLHGGSHLNLAGYFRKKNCVPIDLFLFRCFLVQGLDRSEHKGHP